MTQTEALSNPYVAGSPVSRPEMFFGRSDVFEFVRSALVGQHQDNIIVLYGKRRTGKTSVLYQMHRNLDPRYLPILIDLQSLTMESPAGLFWEIASTIRRYLRREYQIEIPRPQREDFDADPLQGFQEGFMAGVTEAIGDRHLLLMIDEAARLDEQVQAGKLTPDVFGYVRSLMQHNTSLNFMFCVGERLELMQSQYALLFSVALYKEISFLDRKAAEALIMKPVEGLYTYGEAAIDRIIEITSGHAYFMQLLCHSLFSGWQSNNKPEITVRTSTAWPWRWSRGEPPISSSTGTNPCPWRSSSSAPWPRPWSTTPPPVTLGDVDEVLQRYEILVPQGGPVLKGASSARSWLPEPSPWGSPSISFASGCASTRGWSGSRKSFPRRFRS